MRNLLLCSNYQLNWLLHPALSKSALKYCDDLSVLARFLKRDSSAVRHSVHFRPFPHKLQSVCFFLPFSSRNRTLTSCRVCTSIHTSTCCLPSLILNPKRLNYMRYTPQPQRTSLPLGHVRESTHDMTPIGLRAHRLQHASTDRGFANDGLHTAVAPAMLATTTPKDGTASLPTRRSGEHSTPDRLRWLCAPGPPDA